MWFYMRISKECIRQAINQGLRVVILYDNSLDLILTRDIISIENVKRVEIRSMNMLIFKY